MPEQEKPSQTSAAVQFKLATVWQARGHVERAIAGYEEAIRLRPDYVAAHLELGQLLLQHGSAEQAAAVYRRAGAMNPREACFQQKLAELSSRRRQGGAAGAAPPEIGCVATAALGTHGPHIVLYTDCSGISGAEQCNHVLLLALAEAGYRVTCVQGRAAHHLIAEREQRGIRHMWREDDDPYDRTTPARALTDEAEPRQILEATQPDLIIFSDGAPFSNLMAKRVASQQAIPYVVVVHCVTAAWAEQYAPYLHHLPDIYRRAGAVIAVSHAMLRLLRERFGLPDHLGQVIYNGRPARFFALPDPAARQRVRQELGLSPDAVLVCTVASMEMRKGYQYLLKAIKELRDCTIWSRLAFAWVGSGSLEPQLRAAVEHLGARERVAFLGQRADVIEVLGAADIFVLVSQYEGMPLSVMEAMAQGLPVAATGVSGVPEELGNTGKLLPDPALGSEPLVRDLVATINAWATEPASRKAVGVACRRRAAAMFTDDRMRHAYLTVLSRALDSPAVSQPEQHLSAMSACADAPPRPDPARSADQDCGSPLAPAPS